MGRFSVDAFAPSTAYLEVVRENWVGTGSFPFQFVPFLLSKCLEKAIEKNARSTGN